MYGTYATNKTILYLQNNTYLQCEILTLLTILYSTYNTKLTLKYRLTHENQLELKLKNVNLKMIYVTYNAKITKHQL